MPRGCVIFRHVVPAVRSMSENSFPRGTGRRWMPGAWGRTPTSKPTIGQHRPYSRRTARHAKPLQPRPVRASCGCDRAQVQALAAGCGDRLGGCRHLAGQRLNCAPVQYRSDPGPDAPRLSCPHRAKFNGRQCRIVQGNRCCPMARRQRAPPRDFVLQGRHGSRFDMCLTCRASRESTMVSISDRLTLDAGSKRRARAFSWRGRCQRAHACS